MFGFLASYFVLGMGYAPFADLVVLPFLVVLAFGLFNAGHMPWGRKPFLGTLLNTVIFFLLFTLIYPASIWFSEFRSFRSIADILFIGVFLLEIVSGGIILLILAPWILKAPSTSQRQWRSYMTIIPLGLTIAGYAVFTVWRHHVGYHP